MKALYKEVTQWQDKTFTKATTLSCANHLLEEVAELLAVLSSNTTKQPTIYGNEEIADCFILLFGICNKLGMSYEHIKYCINKKMDVNRARKWGEVNEKGYVKHIKEDNQ